MDKKIIERFHHFLSKIPVAFRNKYTDVNYFWISNGEGFKYIEWCCKLLGFPCNAKNVKV